MSAVIAIDAGTTGVRSIAVFPDGRQSIASYREFTQHFPQPGWVEHDANDIWRAVRDTLNDVIGKLDQPPAAIGITNQRETVVAWSKSSGEPLHRAIVWQDRRTADRCDELSAHLDMVRDRTGLVLDPYFSGSKMEWLLRSKSVTASSDLAFGTIDSFIIWKLSGGQAHVGCRTLRDVRRARVLASPRGRLEWTLCNHAPRQRSPWRHPDLRHCR